MPGAPVIDAGVYELGVPVLGICYGAQLLAQQLGGEVAATGRGEYGRTELETTGSASVLLNGDQPVWMSHFDSIVRAPEGFSVTARTADVAVAVLEDRSRRIHGVQFHPEVGHTPGGQEMLRRFLFDVCGCRPTWTMASIVDTQIEAVRRQVGAGRAICGLSGGVDSAVAAALVHRAIGPQLTCVYVDTGLMRQGESEQVVETFRRHMGIELIHVDAGERFFERLAGHHRARGEAQDHRRAVRADLRGEHGRPHRCRVPRPGHPVPRRHRERHGPRRGHQEPPQRRRVCRRT